MRLAAVLIALLVSPAFGTGVQLRWSPSGGATQYVAWQCAAPLASCVPPAVLATPDPAWSTILPAWDAATVCVPGPDCVAVLGQADPLPGQTVNLTFFLSARAPCVGCALPYTESPPSNLVATALVGPPVPTTVPPSTLPPTTTTVVTPTTTTSTTMPLPCSTAISLAPLPGNVGIVTSGDTRTATGGGLSAACAAQPSSTGQTAYAWTPPVSGLWTVDTCSPLTAIDTVLTVRQGCPGTVLACADDTPGCPVAGDTGTAAHGSRVSVLLTAGIPTVLTVSAFGPKPAGAFQLHLTPPPVPTTTSTSTTTSTWPVMTSTSTSTTSTSVPPTLPPPVNLQLQILPNGTLAVVPGSPPVPPGSPVGSAAVMQDQRP